MRVKHLLALAFTAVSLQAASVVGTIVTPGPGTDDGWESTAADPAGRFELGSGRVTWRCDTWHYDPCPRGEPAQLFGWYPPLPPPDIGIDASELLTGPWKGLWMSIEWVMLTEEFLAEPGPKTAGFGLSGWITLWRPNPPGEPFGFEFADSEPLDARGTVSFQLIEWGGRYPTVRVDGPMTWVFRDVPEPSVGLLAGASLLMLALGLRLRRAQGLRGRSATNGPLMSERHERGLGSEPFRH
jgi:hypothetical protein